MSFLRKLFYRMPKAEYRLFVHNQDVRRDSPLPATMPGLYRDKPRDRYARLEELMAETDAAVGDTLHLMRISGDRVRRCFAYNGAEVLRIPSFYRLALHLRKRGMERFVGNAHRLAAAVQACACFGSSDLGDRLREQLMPVLVGIYGRHYGVQFLKDNDLRNLLQQRRFNPEDPKERELRDRFLVAYKEDCRRLAAVSADRLEQQMAPPDPADDGVQAALDTVRYSMRLMGRTATDLANDEELGIHYLATYVGVIHSLMSAHAATGKRLPVLLAEEIDRAQTHHAVAGRELSARYNIRALHDMVEACRCEELDFFQGTDENALYAAPERLYIRRARDGDGVARWHAFRSTRRDNAATASRGKRGSSIEQNASLDPSDADLVRVSDQFRE